MLFGADLHSENPQEAFQNYMDVTLETPVSDLERAELLRKTGDILAKREELDADIDGITEGWNTKRIGKAELNILRLAVYELKYDDAVPTKVAINEAVELSKEYGEEGAHAFVNGILAKLLDKLQESGAAK